MMHGLEHSPYLLIKKALVSRFKLHAVLERLREFRHRHCPLLQLDSDSNFVLNNNAVNNFIACSLNHMHLGNMNYRICDFLNSPQRQEESAVASEMLWQISASEDDLEIDHSICNAFVANNIKADKCAIREILPFHVKHFEIASVCMEGKSITKDVYLTQNELIYLIGNAIDDQCREVIDQNEKDGPQTAVLILNDLDSTQFMQNVAEGLNFVRKYDKPCIFVVKFHNLHCGIIVLPLPEVNKYKFLAIARSQNDIIKNTLNKIRKLAFDLDLLRDDYLISGQYLYFDYKFNANFDIKILLSAIRILPYYKTQEVPQSATTILNALDDWNNYPFSTIEEHLNYLCNYQQNFDTEVLRYSVS